MACILTQNIPLSCRDGVGGVNKVYITELDNKESITVTAGEVTALALSTGKRFWQYDQEIEKAFFNENIQTSRENGTVFYEQDATIVIMKGQKTVRNEVVLLAQTRLMIIILDNNGVYWLVGATSGAMLEPSTFGTGTAKGDMNGYTLNFKAKENTAAYTVDPTIIADLLVAAS